MTPRRPLSLFLSACLLLTAAACGSDRPSLKEVETLVSPLIEEGQDERVEMVGFTKVSDQLEDVGIPTYLISYVAAVEFELDSLVEFSSERPYVRAYPLEPARPACATLGKSPTDATGTPVGAVWNCIRVNRGERLRIEGTLRFEKAGKGWAVVRGEWLDPNKMTLEPAKR
jgi:hypothetical protein